MGSNLSRLDWIGLATILITIFIQFPSHIHWRHWFNRRNLTLWWVPPDFWIAVIWGACYGLAGSGQFLLWRNDGLGTMWQAAIAIWFLMALLDKLWMYGFHVYRTFILSAILCFLAFACGITYLVLTAILDYWLAWLNIPLVLLLGLMIFVNIYFTIVVKPLKEVEIVKTAAMSVGKGHIRRRKYVTGEYV